MYLTPTNSHWACDIEANGLLEDATVIHCVCVENVVTGEAHAFTDKEELHAWMDRSVVFVGHNFIAYDSVLLNRLWDTRIPISRIVDTYVLSQLYNPNYPGGHSLEAWGLRLKHPKGEFNDWSNFSDEMLEYCRNDCSLTAILYRKLTQRMRDVGFTESGCRLESLSWNIIQNKQRKHGFPFDKQRAEELYAELRHRQKELESEIFVLFPPELLCVGEYRKAFKGNGEYSKQYERHVQQYPESEVLKDGSYRVFDYVPFNIGSPKQRVEKLLALGWQPINYTEKGNPKIDEDELLKFAEESGKPEVTAIAKWLVVNSRANMIRTWLDAYNENTGAIHGKLFIASTLRYRHSNPNTANIPAVRKDKDDNTLFGEEGTWAYECRDLFHCSDPEKYSLVGVDAKGLQLRILANYAYSEDFANTVLTGDPHKRNIELLGLANKAAAKKFIYTLIMGGGGARLAADQAQFGTKLTAKQGHMLKKKMIESIPGFRDLIRRLEDELSKTGRIRLCDGTPILVPSYHMVIPYLLQGDESRLMKQAGVYLDEEIRRHRYDAYKVGDIHDEWQFKVSNKDLEGFTNKALKVFPRSGDFFNYRVPIEGDVKVGKTWAETH